MAIALEICFFLFLRSQDNIEDFGDVWKVFSRIGVRIIGIIVGGIVGRIVDALGWDCVFLY